MIKGSITEEDVTILNMNVPNNSSRNTKTQETTVLRIMWRKSNTCAVVVGMETSAATAEGNSMEVP